MKINKKAELYLSYMGQFPNLEISDAILEYLHFSVYSTPKQLLREIYPIYQNRYSEDTFRRLLTRNINRLRNEKKILEHPLRPFYYLPECRWVLDGDILMAVRNDKYFIIDQNENLEIVDASAKPPERGAYTFIEHLKKERGDS